MLQKKANLANLFQCTNKSKMNWEWSVRRLEVLSWVLFELEETSQKDLFKTWGFIYINNNNHNNNRNNINKSKNDFVKPVFDQKSLIWNNYVTDHLLRTRIRRPWFKVTWSRSHMGLFHNYEIHKIIASTTV